MKLLREIKPAEGLLLLELGRASLPKLIRVTFVDLLLRKVLRLESAEPGMPAHHRQVAAGPAFANYPASPHEQHLLWFFRNAPETRIQPRHLVRAAQRRLRNRKALHATLAQAPWLRGVLTQSVWQRLLDRYDLTPAGDGVRLSLKTELAELDRYLPHWVETNPAKVVEVLESIRGNVMLLAPQTLRLLAGAAEDARRQQSLEENYAWNDSSWIIFSDFSYNDGSSGDSNWFLDDSSDAGDGGGGDSGGGDSGGEGDSGGGDSGGGDSGCGGSSCGGACGGGD